jgi:hypothetical protein
VHWRPRIEYRKNIEPAPIAAELSPTTVPLFDGGIVVRIAGNLGAGVAFSSLTRTDEAQITARIPHPYDTASFARSEVNRQRASKPGFHGGADVTWKLGPRWGLGGLLRYSKASVPFGGRSVDAGGLQAGGGLRVLF